MFHAIGQAVARRGSLFVVAWLALLVSVWRSAPEWNVVAKSGEFDFLPDSTPSRQGQKLLNQAFPNEEFGSSVVLVVHRGGTDAGLLTESDKSFVNQTLVPRLRELVDSNPTRFSRVRSPADELVGPLLQSRDGQAVLVLADLKTDFMDLRNREPVKSVESLLMELRHAESVPQGLMISVSGSATMGRDLNIAQGKSARAVELATLLLVIALLVFIYRAPLPALIPLTTVFIAVNLSLKLLSILALHEIVGLFDGVQTYVTVILYGAGVDYCLFLTARYREEIERGASYDQAIEIALTKVGAALVASAGTVIGGIGMMVFAEFGKFREAGVAISFSLVVVLLAVLTLSSVLLRMAGRWAFWPGRVASSSSQAPPALHQDEKEFLSRPLGSMSGWERVGHWIARRPVLALSLCVGLMVPFSTAAVVYRQFVSFGPLNNLPADAVSVVGTRDLQAHFPGGVTGPLTILVHSPQSDFRADDIELVTQLSDWLSEHHEDLRLVDVRSIAHPLGITEVGEHAFEGFSPAQRIARRSVLRNRASDFYVSHAEPLAGSVTRMELIFQDDSFSRGSIAHLDRIEPQLRTEFAKILPADATLRFVGSTPSIRDLKAVRTADQLRINGLVCLTVFVILVVLLRQPLVCLFLVLSMLLGYAATYGATLLVFWMLDPTGFPGLDWKLPMLLFTILVAVGEDYNIFLMSRVAEEQARHGPVGGVIAALAKTGGIISSCGVIMAGTFSALMFGSLVSMRQLGFALAFGVLLDTFVIRPVLVPAFLVLWHRKSPNESSVSMERTE
jgi:RND superfamily putative drug exporter